MLVPVRTEKFFGATSTVVAMRDAILAAQTDYRVRQLAELICAGVRAKDYLSEALAIYYYVLANMRYMRDPRVAEMVKEPGLFADQFMNGAVPQGDCNNMAALIAALILVTGGTARLVTVAFSDMFYEGERQYSHVFCQCKVGPNWITLDPVPVLNTKKMMGQIKAAKIWDVA